MLLFVFAAAVDEHVADAGGAEEERCARLQLAHHRFARYVVAVAEGVSVEEDVARNRANIGAPAPDKALQARILESLDRISWSALSYQDKLDLLRAYTLAFTRFGEEDTSKAGGKPDQLYGVRGKLLPPSDRISNCHGFMRRDSAGRNRLMPIALVKIRPRRFTFTRLAAVTSL